MARTSSYYLYEKFEKRGDQDWIPSYPNVYSKDGDGTMPLVVRIAQDYECGWRCDPEYQWVELPITSGYVCDECGELGQVTHKWELVEGYLCEGTTKYQKLNLNVNVGNGWEEVSPIISKPGELIEEKSVDCGYQNPRMRATLADGTIKEVPYAGQGVNPTAFLDATKIMNYGIPISQIRIAEFYGTELYYDAFAGCQTLSSVTFHNAEHFYDGSFFFFGSGLRNFTGKITGFGTGRWSIGFTFANCKNLTAFTETSDKYHDGINGYGIFANCTGLTSMDLSMLGMYGTMDYEGGGGGAACLFGGCTNLQTAKIALSVPGLDTTKRNSIPTACFDSCTNISDVELYCGFELNNIRYAHPTVTIDSRAFFNCKNLTAITFSYHDEEAAPSTIGDAQPLYGDTYITSDGIYPFAFFGCEKLPVSEIEDKLGIAGTGATTATSITGVCSYAGCAFTDCKAFTHIPIPKWSSRLISDPQGGPHEVRQIIPVTNCSISNIGAYCFSGCTGLHDLEFDGNLTNIGKHAFDGCTGLTGVTFTGTVPPTFGRGSFHNTNNCPIYVPCGKILEYINALNNQEADDEYSSRVRGIPPCSAPTYSMKFTARYNTGDSHFVYCDSSSIITSGEVGSRESITSVTIGNCATEIAKDAFKNCTGLTSVTIGTGVTTFRQSVFSSCSNLTSVDIPSNVSRIENYGFIYCRNLETVYVRSVSPPYLGWTGTQHISEVFSNTSPNLVIYVPSQSVNNYRTATGWSTYASKIQPMP